MNLRNSFIILCLVLFVNPSPIFAQWVSTTMPGSPLSEVYSLCVKDSELFAGTVDGVYKSSDNGAHWQEVNPILPARAYQPTVWSLTVNGKYLIAAFSECNVYISSDDGASWTSSGGEGFGTTPLITAASENYILGGNVTFATYRSTDNGASWAELGSPYAVRSIAMQDSIALASGYAGWAGVPIGIFRSNDYGATWNLMHECQPEEVRGNPIALSGIRAVAGITDYPNCYALSSTDAGLTWPDSVNINCNSINSIVFSPVQSGINFVFAGTDSGVFRSSDNGAHWAAENNGLTSTLVYSLACTMQGAGGQTTLFAGTGGGLFFSTDFGDTWSQTLGPSQWVYTSDGSTLYAGASNGTYYSIGVLGQKFDYKYCSVIYRSTDDGQNWAEMYSGYLDRNAQATSLAVAHDNSNGLHLLAEGAWSPPPYVQSYLVLSSSTDKGVSWKTTYNDSVLVQGALMASSSIVLMSAIGNSILSAYVFRSTDAGNTWTIVDTVPAYMKALSTDGNKIYVGGSILRSSRVTATLTQYLEVSTDQGITWAHVASPLDSQKTVSNPTTDTLSVITSLYATGPHLLIGMEAYEFYESVLELSVVNGGGLYHLVQDGSTWDLVDSALMGRSVFGFAASGSSIFAATDSGVFRSTNDGTSWTDISSGMNNIYVQSLFVSGSYLFASTSNGLWKRPLSEITSVGRSQSATMIPESYSLSQNYPNPFNPATIIKYQLPENSIVTLKVFDVVGREVLTLVNAVQHAGSYTIHFDGSALASGVYMYRLTTEHFIDVKKMILLK